MDTNDNRVFLEDPLVNTLIKGEQDTAELGANTDANHTYTNKKNEICSGRYFLFDAYDRICFFLGISYFYINSKRKMT